ncbi:MAG TPA: hypothetical protein VMU19_10920, partial [Bryobacteraceae bacterium]|nr:hypothetical protein [Bryobacteraceae bacterium]
MTEDGCPNWVLRAHGGVENKQLLGSFGNFGESGFGFAGVLQSKLALTKHLIWTRVATEQSHLGSRTGPRDVGGTKPFGQWAWFVGGSTEQSHFGGGHGSGVDRRNEAILGVGTV